MAQEALYFRSVLLNQRVMFDYFLAEVKFSMTDYLLISSNLSLNVNNILLTFSSNFIGSLINHR